MIKTINLNKTVKWAVTSLLVISLQGFLFADDDNDKVGSVAFKFLNIETDARTAALGGTSAQASGAAAMFSNPAGLSSSSGLGLSAGMSQWLVETDIMSVGVTFPLAGGVAGLGAVSVDYGDMLKSGWGETGGQFVFEPNQGSFTATDMSLQFSYAKSLSDKFSIGGSAKMISQSIDDVDISGMAYDIGMQFSTGYRGIRMGAVISNFGPDVETEPVDGGYSEFPSMSLPMTFSFGVIAEALPGLNAGLNVLKQADMVQQYIVNAEYSLSVASLRFSYNLNDEQAPMSMGGGVSIAGADIGVAMTTHDALDSVIRISLGYSF